MDRGGWQATVHGATKSQTQLSDFHFRTLFFVFYSIMVYLRICNRVPRALQEGLVVYPFYRYWVACFIHLEIQSPLSLGSKKGLVSPHDTSV